MPAVLRRTLVTSLVAGLWSCGGGDDVPSRQLNTPAGTSVAIGLSGASATFGTVTSPGNTTATPIDPSAIGSLPGGYFSINGAAYDVTTTATYTGNIVVCIQAPSITDPTVFSTVAIFHF